MEEFDRGGRLPDLGTVRAAGGTVPPVSACGAKPLAAGADEPLDLLHRLDGAPVNVERFFMPARKERFEDPIHPRDDRPEGGVGGCGCHGGSIPSVRRAPGGTSPLS